MDIHPKHWGYAVLQLGIWRDAATMEEMYGRIHHPVVSNEKPHLVHWDIMRLAQQVWTIASPDATTPDSLWPFEQAPRPNPDGMVNCMFYPMLNLEGLQGLVARLREFPLSASNGSESPVLTMRASDSSGLTSFANVVGGAAVDGALHVANYRRDGNHFCFRVEHANPADSRNDPVELNSTLANALHLGDVPE